MVKSKKTKKKSSSSSNTTTTTTGTTTTSSTTTTGGGGGGTTTISGSFTLNRDANGQVTSITNNNTNYSTNTNTGSSSTSASASNNNPRKNKSSSSSSSGITAGENLDDLAWLRESDLRHTATGEPYLQLEYQDDDELIIILQKFLETSTADKTVIDSIYQIWQQTVLSTLLQSSAVWRKETVTAADQRQMKDILKTARYKINFIMHHVTGGMLTSTAQKWTDARTNILEMCYNTLVLIPRLAESCPHSPTDIRLAIIHFEGKEFLAAVACETWDTLYDYSIEMDANKFIPVLRRCAMLDILDKDWNMLGGWEDILKGLEAKCCSAGHHRTTTGVHRLPSDAVLHETTTILRNARNSMQCKFFSVRFMRYTEDQAPQRWRYFPKCSAPACGNIETETQPHQYRCQKCWYFHYCSPACQEYCDNIMGLHPKFCKDTPKSKAALCRKETEQYLGWSPSSNRDDSGGESNDDNNNDALTKITCQACGAIEQQPDDNDDSKNSNAVTSSSSSSTMKRCQQCHMVVYCSRQCQEWDWRVGGHREVCNKATAATAATTEDDVAVDLKDLN